MRAAAAVLVASAALATAAGAAAATPTLRLVRTPAFVVVGEHFRPGERVTVTVAALGVHIRRVVAVGGSFRADFGPLAGGRCAPLHVLAVGARGSRASLAFPARACTPTPPAP